MSKRASKKQVVMIAIAAVAALLLGAVLFLLNFEKKAESPFLGQGKGYKAELREPSYVATSVLRVSPGSSIDRDPRVYNSGSVAFCPALRVEFTNGEGERLSEEQADLLFRFIRLIRTEECLEWQLVLPTEGDEALQTYVWLPLDWDGEAKRLSPGEVTPPVFTGIYFDVGISEAERNWMSGAADLSVGTGDAAHMVPVIKGGFAIKYEGAIIGSDILDSNPEFMLINILYDMLNPRQDARIPILEGEKLKPQRM